jgi:Ca2+-binding RTX toxin-like protein
MSSLPFLYSGFAYPFWHVEDYGSSWSAEAFAAVAATGSNSISIVPTIYISDAWSSDFQAGPTTETEANTIAGIEAARARGLRVILKPHVDALDGTYRGSFAPSDADAWFAGYKEVLLRYARIAAQTGAEALSIGCELAGLTGTSFRDRWADIIDAVRAVYGGQIIYAADWAEARQVSFWDLVDVIGVDAYYPLSPHAAPDAAELVAAWTVPPASPNVLVATEGKSIVDFLHDLALLHGKPLMLTEVGYRSFEGAAASPGTWDTAGAANQPLQAALYEALFQVWASHGGDWFLGMQLWNWEPGDGSNHATGYTPQGKEALALAAEWLAGTRIAAGRLVEGTASANVLDGGLGSDTLLGGGGDDLLRGGWGDDLLVGGPDVLVALTSTTITVSARGDIVHGVGGRFVILVDWTQLGPVFEAGDAFAEFSVTFANAGPVGSVGVQFLNDYWSASEDRNLHLRSFTVNGNPLSRADAVNPSGNGTWDIWCNSALHHDVAGRQDWFLGAASDRDTLQGGMGDDTLRGGAGDNWLEGGAGADLFVAAGGADFVKDFTPGLDALLLEGLGAGDVTLGAGAGDGLLLTFRGGGSILLAGVHALRSGDLSFGTPERGGPGSAFGTLWIADASSDGAAFDKARATFLALDGRDDLIATSSLAQPRIAMSGATLAIDEVAGGTTTISLHGGSPGFAVAMRLEDGDGGRYRLDGVAQVQLHLHGEQASAIDLAGVSQTRLLTGGGDDMVRVEMSGGAASSAVIDTGAGDDTIVIQGGGAAQVETSAGAGADTIRLHGLLGGVVDPGAGADLLQLGAHGEIRIILARGAAGGDVITGFAGAGRRGGDILELHGYDAGAKLTALGDGRVRVSSADGFAETFTLTGVSKLAAHDLVWS